MIQVDSSFVIGKGHKVCQDYSFHGAVTRGSGEVLQLAVVSDGCSSSPHTDIGARILTLSFVRAVLDYYDLLTRETESLPERRKHALPVLERIVIQNAFSIAQAQGLPSTCLDATLLAMVSDSCRTSVMAWGDGMIHYRCREASRGNRSWYLLQNESAAPYYLSYLLEPDRKEQYRQTYGWPQSLTLTSFGDRNLAVPDPPQLDEHVSFYQEYRHVDHAPFTLAASSDGIMAFATEKGQPVPVEDLVEEVAGFKNLHGEFVHRRLSKFMKRSVQRNWTHMDDLSLAAVAVG